MLSQYVERDHAGELLADGRGGVGYLLKDRVHRLAITDNAVHEHVGSIIATLGLQPTVSGHRRVLAHLNDQQ